MRIVIRSAIGTVGGTLADEGAGAELARLLPLEVSLTDFHGTERIGDLPRALDVHGAPASATPSAQDICYYTPWGNLAVFVRDFTDSVGLVRLGRLDGSIMTVCADGAATLVTIEAA